MSKELEKSFKRKNLAPYLYFKKIEEICGKDQLCYGGEAFLCC